jgi:hypothetical protein
MPEAPQPGLRLRDAMPRPLLITFAVVAVVAIAAAALVLLKPSTFESVPLGERRPPPRGTFSHDVGSVIPAPTPSVQSTLDPPCSAVAGARLIGGGDGVLRLRAALEQACRLEQGVSPAMTRAVQALNRATIRFGFFTRTGVESTLDHATNTISLNLKFAQRKVLISHLVPVLLHEGVHLQNASESTTAVQELGARRIEVAACRQLIEIKRWPRWCHDARALTDLDEAQALALLRAAGYV